MGHPIRLCLVALLSEKRHNVSELTSILEVKQSIVSQQLAILRRERLVAAVRIEGMAVYYVLEPQLRAMVRCLERCASSSFAAEESRAGVRCSLASSSPHASS